MNLNTKHSPHFCRYLYTEALYYTNRCCKIVGNIGTALDQAHHDANSCDTDETSSHKQQFDYIDDVKYFVASYKKDDLFGFTEGRQHKSFPQFRVDTIRSPQLLKLRLMAYSENLDRMLSLYMYS